MTEYATAGPLDPNEYEYARGIVCRPTSLDLPCTTAELLAFIGKSADYLDGNEYEGEDAEIPG